MALLAGVAVLTGLVLAAVVIDSGYMLVTKVELQNVADVAADSAVIELSRIYDELGKQNPDTYTLSASDQARILDSVNRITNQNTVAGLLVDIIPSDITYGRWEYADGGMSDQVIFTETTTGPTAVSVAARRDESANGVVDTLLASLVDIDEFRVSAEASAALTPLSVLPAGRIELPVGVSKEWFENRTASGLPRCGEDASLSLFPLDDWSSCVGWTTFDSLPSDATTLEAMIRGIQDGSVISPEVRVGMTAFEFFDLDAYEEDVEECCGNDSVALTEEDSDAQCSDEDWDGHADHEKVTICHIPPGNPEAAHEITIGASAVRAHITHHGDYLGQCECGEASKNSVLRAIRDLYEERKDADGEWRVQVPVYDAYDCSTPQGQVTIVGIATLVITGVELPVVCCEDTGSDGVGDHGEVTVCHYPPGNTDNPHTMKVQANKLQAHKNHGDYVGECHHEEDACVESEGSVDANVACCVLQYGEGGGPDFGTRLAFPLTVD